MGSNKKLNYRIHKMEAISKEIKMGHKSYTYPILQGGHLLETVVHWCNDPKTFKTFL